MCIDDNSGKGKDDITTINHWLRTCQRDHVDCSVFNASSYLPTRLIDVGSHAQDPRLTLTHDVEVTDPRYLALSHCWGTTMPQSATTTLATMAERLERIPLDSLPRTFVEEFGGSACVDRLHVHHLGFERGLGERSCSNGISLFECILYHCSIGIKKWECRLPYRSRSGSAWASDA